MHANTQQNNNNDLGKIGKAFVEINNYLNNIYEPLRIINSTLDKSSFSNISFNSPYAIQFNTTFSFQKEDIDFLFKDIAEADKQPLMEILNKNYGINDNAKYPIKIKYCELIELLKQITINEKISGLCLEKYLKLLSSKITEKKIHRGKISSTVGKATFGVGLVSVGTTLFGFVASVPLVGYVGLGIMVFFAGFSMISRSVNMSNEIKKQSYVNEIKNAANVIENICSMVESKIGNSLKYKQEQQNKKENNKKDNQKKTDKNINQSNNFNITDDQNKKTVVENNDNKLATLPEKTTANNKDEDKFNDIIKNYSHNEKENNNNDSQPIIREIITGGEGVKIPNSMHKIDNKVDTDKKEQKEEEDKKETIRQDVNKNDNRVKKTDENVDSQVLNLKNIVSALNLDEKNNKHNENTTNGNKNDNANDSSNNNKNEDKQEQNSKEADRREINNTQINNSLNVLSGDKKKQNN